MNAKTCTACGLTKPLDEFYKHPSGALGRDPECKECGRAKARLHHHTNRDHRNQQRREHIQRTGVEVQYAKNQAWKEANPERHLELRRQSWLKRHYRMTLEQYDALLSAQGGVCAICSRPPTKQFLAVDHDHACCSGSRTCGQCVRGLLCGHCNRQLGWVEKWLAPLLAYINRYRR